MPKTAKPVPAYIPWQAFMDFIAHLKGAGVVPSRIDKSLMGHLPALTQGQIATTLRFLRLVGESDSTDSGALQKVVDAYDTDNWPAVLKQHVVPSYDDIIAGLKLDVATPHQLDECFDRVVRKTVMRDKSVRFLLSLLTDAGVTFSPHLTKRSVGDRSARSKNTTKKKSRKTAKKGSHQEPPAPPTGNANQTPIGMIDFRIPISKTESFIRVPEEITTQQYLMVSAVVNVVEQLAKQNSEEA